MTVKVEFVELMEAGCQWGHGQRDWSPKMAPYIFGVRRGIHVINLFKSRPLLQKAVTCLHNIAAGNG